MRLDSFEYIIDVLNDTYGEDDEKLRYVFERLDKLVLKFSLYQFNRYKATKLLLEGVEPVDVAKRLNMNKHTVWYIRRNLIYDMEINNGRK
jgi:hypothetical protein